MISRKTTFSDTGFAVMLLLVVCTIRSGIMVDSSYLPRLFLLTLILLLATVLLFRKSRHLPVPRYTMVFLAFFAWNLLSAGWSQLPSEAIAESSLVFAALSLFVITGILVKRNPNYEKIFIGVSLLALAFSFCLAFYKMSKLQFFDPYRIIGISANNNLYAGFLLISLPLVLAVFFMIITQSRAVYLGLSFSFILLMLVLLFRYRSRFTLRNGLTGFAAILLLSAGIFLFYSSLDLTRKSYFLSKIPVWQYFRSYDDKLKELREKQQRERAELTGIASFDFAGSYYENANLRIIFWKRSATLIAAHPITGVGAGNWRILAPSVPKPENPDHIWKNYTYSQPHNEWIAFAAELGIPGLILALVILIGPVAWLLFIALFRRQKPLLSTAIYASFLGGFYLFASFDFPFRRVEHSVIVFTILAFLMQKIPGQQQAAEKGNDWWRYMRFVVLAGLLCTLVVTSLRIRGELYTRMMFRNEGKDHEKVILYGNQALNPFYRITPNTLPVDWFIGVARFNLKQPEAALASFSRALTVTPWEVRVLNDHATALYQLGKGEEAKAELRKSITIDPWFDDARFNLAAMYYFGGQRDSALLQVARCRNSQKKTDFLEELEK